MSFINRIKPKLCRYFRILQILFGLIWLSGLSRTDAYFSIYVLIAFFSMFLTIRSEGYSSVVSPKRMFRDIFLSVVFSVLILLANYPLFTTIGDPAVISRETSILMNFIDGLFCFIGGVCIFFPILRFLFDKLPVYVPNTSNLDEGKYIPFFIFLFISSVHLIHLFLVEYPGNVTEDTFSQISEMISGQYSNFNTYWHTRVLQSVLSLGYSVFHNLNAAIALFSVFQILIMAFSFTYCLMTMRQYGVPGWCVVLFSLIYACMPYHLALSVTLWKDVLFAGGCLLILTSLFRLNLGLSKSKLFDYVVLILGSFLFILSRTNGWIIYLVFALINLFFFHKRTKVSAALCAMAILGWILLNPMLALFNISDVDIVESLSVPIQQVSRVIADGCEISDEDSEFLSRIADLDEVPELYTNWLSDPMKVEVRSKNYSYFRENISNYRDLWLRLGMQYPWEYVKAWVDQTKGYWNAGYGYAMYSETVTDNPYGVEKCVGSNPVAILFRIYFGLSRHLVLFEPLHSIGLHIWILGLCFLVNLFKKREEWILSVPLLLLVLGLLFGTPVYACFRYVYPVFVCIPLILSTTIFSGRNISA